MIGNVEDRFQERIGIALGALLGAAQDTGKRQHHLLKGLSSEAALDLVMWAVFGDDAVHPELTDADCKLLARSEIISSKGGPAFDDWEVIIVESCVSASLPSASMTYWVFSSRGAEGCCVVIVLPSMEYVSLIT